jgi:hypothetical protein
LDPYLVQVVAWFCTPPEKRCIACHFSALDPSR